MQAHPEFRPEFVDGLIETRGKGLVPDAVLAAATAKRDTPLSSQTMAGRIAAFFKEPRVR